MKSVEELIEFANNYIPTEQEELILEKSYQDTMLWEEDIDNLEKARVVAPIGTVKMSGGAEYIKTAEGWRYHTTSSRTKTQDHYSKSGKATPAHLQGDMGTYKKNTGGNTSFKVKEGASLTAKDGTKGEVVSHDGQSVTIKFKGKDGKEQTVKSDALKLEHNVASGNIKHTASKEHSDQEKEPDHEDNDDNIKSAAESEKKLTSEEKKKEPAKKTAAKTKSKGSQSNKGDINTILTAQGLDPNKYSDIMKNKDLSDGEKLSLIAIRIAGEGNEKGSISGKKKGELKKSDVFNGGLIQDRSSLIKSLYGEDDLV